MTYHRPTRAPIPAPPSIARATAAIFRNLAKRTKYVDPALAERWPQIAGEKLDGLCRPGRLTGRAGKQGGGRTLELYVPNGAAAAVVDMERDGLLSRLNAYLGPGAVTRISVIQTGRAASASSTGSEAPPADGELGSALASFRAAVRSRNGGK